MNKRNNGFTLVELIVVIAIIGILAGIAYPSYKQYLVKTRRADAMSVLQQFANAMERHYLARNSYLGAGTCANAGGDANSACAPAANVFASQAPLDGKKFYNLTIDGSTTATTYLLVATPFGDQAGDGFIQLSSTGARGWDEDDNLAIDVGPGPPPFDYAFDNFNWEPE